MGITQGMTFTLNLVTGNHYHHHQRRKRMEDKTIEKIDDMARFIGAMRSVLGDAISDPNSEYTKRKLHWAVKGYEDLCDRMGWEK